MSGMFSPSFQHWKTLLGLILFLWAQFQVEGFQVSPCRHILSTPLLQSASLRKSPLYFWGNNKDKSDDSNKQDHENSDGEEKRINLFPFFASKPAEETVGEKKESASAKLDSKPSPRTPTTLPTDPVEQAAALRAQAERARLEADKMDAELTLRKVARLEKEMATAVAKDKTDDIERLQRDMEALQTKIRREPPEPVIVPVTASATIAENTTSSTSTSASSSQSSIKSFEDGVIQGFWGKLPQIGELQEYTAKDVEEAEKNFKRAPSFIKKLVAVTVEVDFDDIDDINATDVAVRIQQILNLDFSYSKLPPPTFTQADIDRAKEELKGDWLKRQNIGSALIEANKCNDTKLALMALEYEYYMGGSPAFTEDQMQSLVAEEEWLKEIINAVNKSAVDASIESLYPKCTRKEGAVVPTMAQIQQLISDVLPKASFTVRGQPERVLSGYIIRGTSRLKKGDEVIAAIDEQLAKIPMLKDQMTVLWTKDFTVFAQAAEDDDFLFSDVSPDPDSESPILFVMGPDIVADRKRVPLALTTSLGIATSWYLAVYPFLLNPAIMKRTEEQLALADASMAYDLSWLSASSLPLFLAFMGIQLAHEVGHKIAASSYGLKTTFPTLVPSLITGITSSVTTMKEPPKNKEALFDFAIAGPICGILASLAALVVGSQLTVVADPLNFPALPLEILRQSTLGGGIINAILGNGALSLPPGAEGTQAVAQMTVALHPIAVAGYIGLIVNALALLPIGTTDGGRVALALYGRGSKLVVGNIFLLVVFLIGLLGSDLFLFYFAFLIAFQTGNDIPARNEVENISFPRVVVAIACTVVALLSLVPFQ